MQVSKSQIRALLDLLQFLDLWPELALENFPLQLPGDFLLGVFYGQTLGQSPV
jgi:hypothetical protein